MIKKLTCIECPVGCSLAADIENCKVVKVTGNRCPKGEKYAYSEIENPRRILTSSVLAKGLSMKMISVRTDKPIPKTKTLEAMKEVKKIVIDKPVRVGEVVVADFMEAGVNLITTRSANG